METNRRLYESVVFCFYLFTSFAIVVLSCTLSLTTGLGFHGGVTLSRCNKWNIVEIIQIKQTLNDAPTDVWVNHFRGILTTWLVQLWERTNYRNVTCCKKRLRLGKDSAFLYHITSLFLYWNRTHDKDVKQNTFRHLSYYVVKLEISQEV